jgi:hypothetical protein
LFKLRSEADNNSRSALRELSRKLKFSIVGPVRSTGRMNSCRVKLGSKNAFLKIAGLKETNRNVRFEADFCKSWNRWAKTQGCPVSAPKLLAQGRHKGMAYLIRSFEDGTPCLSDSEENANLSEHGMTAIILAFKWHKKYVRAHYKTKRGPGWARWGAALIKQIEQRHIKIPDSLRRIVYSSPKSERLSSVYGDLLPWHLLYRNEDTRLTVCLIDSEQGGTFWPPYADIAWCLTAIAVVAKKPELAEKVFKSFVEAGLVNSKQVVKRALCVRSLYGLLSSHTRQQKIAARKFMKWCLSI